VIERRIGDRWQPFRRRPRCSVRSFVADLEVAARGDALRFFERRMRRRDALHVVADERHERAVELRHQREVEKAGDQQQKADGHRQHDGEQLAEDGAHHSFAPMNW
jgi:hypothetical protein